jgi:hypothetical protein
MNQLTTRRAGGASLFNPFPIADSPLACQAGRRLRLVIRDGIIYDTNLLPADEDEISAEEEETREQRRKT